MVRPLTILLALSAATPGDAIAQSFQFMPFAPRERVSLLPTGGLGDVVDGDLDGDGVDDLVLAGPGGMRVFLRTVGIPQPPVQPIAGWVRPVLVDLDLDGDLDLVCAARNLAAACPAYVFRNAGGTLSPHALPWSAAQALAAVGDVDGDGRADLVVAVPVGQGGPALALLRSGPDLQFTLDTTSMPGGLPYGLWPELLDADGDGDLDILATNATSGLRLLYNQGGTFVDGTASLPPARTGHVFLLGADLDGDGRTDCAAAHGSGDVEVLWGGGTGFTLQAAVAMPGIQRLWPADFDGDGHLDLLAQHDAGLDALWNHGNRNFARETLVEQLPWFVQGAPDLDDDGRTDVVFSRLAPFRVSCKFAARFEDAAFAVGLEPFTSVAMPRTAPLPGDVDGDGRTDLVYVGHDFVCVDRALGGGAYRRSLYPTPSSAIGNTWTAKLADLDADGDLDVVAKSDAALIVASNTGSGAFVSVLQRTSTGQTTDGLRVGDVDGDGDADIVLVADSGVALVRNLGQAQPAPTVVLAPPPVRCVELADVDGDGDLDLVTDVVTASGQAHAILTNDSKGIFTPNDALQVKLGTEPTSVCAGDLDGDGDADLVVADGSPRVYRNDGRGLFSDRTPFDLPTTMDTIVSNLAIADFDDDGDIDIYALTTETPSCLLLLNDGSGRFADHSASRVQFPQTVGTASWRLVAGDFDDDGDSDLTIAASNYRSILVNHVRHCASNAAPRLGGVADLHLHSGPGFGAPGVGLLGVGFALATPPLVVPGFSGRLELDPSTLQIVAAVTTSPVGVSSAFVAMPQDPLLIGLELWFQGAILPSTGAPPGFTNVAYEVVLR